MVNVWESLSLRIGYAKAVLVGVPVPDIARAVLKITLQIRKLLVSLFVLIVNVGQFVHY